MRTMRSTLGTLSALVALAILAGARSDLFAQQPRPTAAKGTPQKGQVTPTAGQARVPVPSQVQAQIPKAPPIDIEEEDISPELEELLIEWEHKSSRIKTLKGTHTRTVYNLVFQQEKVAEGRFFLETPDKGRIDLWGAKIKEGGSSARIGKNGQPYRLTADKSERWICTGDEIVMVNDDERTYQVMPLPEHLKGTNIVNSPLPFLFGMKAADAKRRFKMTLSDKSTREKAFLIVEPRFASDQENYVKAYVMLERVNYLPTAVKMFDPSGSVETVYSFNDVKINDKKSFFDIFEEKEPFHLDFKKMRYTLVLPPSEELEPPARAAANPAGKLPPNTRPIQQPSNTRSTQQQPQQRPINGSGTIKPK